MDERPEYRYLDPPEPNSLGRGIAWGLVFGLVLWFGLFLAALLLIPRISP